MKNISLVPLSIIFLTACGNADLDTSYTLTKEDHAAAQGYGIHDTSLIHLKQQIHLSYTPETEHALDNLPFSTNPHIDNVGSSRPLLAIDLERE